MLDWLLIGIGDISVKRVLPAILSEPRSRLVGLVTRDQRKAEPYGVPAWTSLAKALDSCSATAVYVATPVALHAPQTIACLQAGRHVLCEKPVALNYAEAESMQNVAEQTGKLFGVAYYRRMYPKVDRLKELLSANALGTPVLAEATSHDWFHPEGTQRSWLLDPAMAGGGPLYDIASHRIDLMNYLFGKPARVSGHLSSAVQNNAVEDNATVMIDYESGPRAIVDVRWHSRIPRDEFRVRGTDGEIDLSPLNSPEIRVNGKLERVAVPTNLHFPCVSNFVDAVLDGAQLRSSGRTAIVTDWITEQVTSANYNRT